MQNPNSLPPYRPFEKVLIANRGEIAVRVIKACRERGLGTVAVYSEADRYAPHVLLADEAVFIGPSPSRESYLNFDAVLGAAARTGADAVHPGYGFLAENADFAQACLTAGLVWIGPQPEAIAQMGSKTAARQLAESLDIPVIPGWRAESGTDRDFAIQAESLGYPVLLKAVAGGGGRGMRRVENAGELPAALTSARREALQAFGDERVYLEKYLPAVRHIEFQILGDAHGHLLHAFERECSLQRRYQKILEESPSPVLSAELREKMGEAAVRLGRALSYCGAGTVEFVLDQAQGAFYFLEVNTRLQVEHPVTELVIGHDLVRWQLKLAAGEPLILQQRDLRQGGHAIEVRICAEDPQNDFRPGTGTILRYLQPDLMGVRFDGGVTGGSRIPVDYDSMLLKLIVWGHTREVAIQRLKQALARTAILGVQTNLGFLRRLAAHPAFATGGFHTRWIEAHVDELLAEPLSTAQQHELALVATLWGWRQRQGARNRWRGLPSGWRNSPAMPQQSLISLGETSLSVSYEALGGTPEPRFRMQIADSVYQVRLALSDAANDQLSLEIDGLRRSYSLAQSAQTLWLHAPALGTHQLGLLPRLPAAARDEGHGGYTAAMTAKVLQVLVETGQLVEAGQSLLVLESMKMESTLCAAGAGVVSQVLVTPGEVVEAGVVLLEITAAEES